ncbi:MAG: histidine--tRNA ligase [Acidimicrobiia bacterium]|nr:histidine--tRNA ligase [Acidimicrobiia bacterium]
MVERPNFRAPKGTQDVLPPESARWEALLAIFSDVARRFGYGLVQSPMFEDIGVFQRIGEGTDVVAKEMYDFEDKGGRHLALRPEGTAPVARAWVQHRPAVPWKVWYATPAFRYEQPQAGRLRQHHQVGVECIGSADPHVDVEIIALGHAYLWALGLRQWRLVLNFMGTPADRAAYGVILQAWLRARASEIPPADAAKIDAHPLRVLDSKDPVTAALLVEAPPMADHLDGASRAHGDAVQDGLRALGITFEIDPSLVRGLDYYTHTLFEFQSSALGNAQSTILGGGRYDGLIEQLGGPATPGIGFGSGIERVLLTCDAEGVFDRASARLDCFVIDTTGGTAAVTLTQVLRQAGLSADRSFDDRSMKAQMKAAVKASARLALIVGEQEAATGTVAVRDLDHTEQATIDIADVVHHVRQVLHR